MVSVVSVVLSVCPMASLLVTAPAFARTNEVERNLEAMIGHTAAEAMAEEYGTIDNPLLQDWVQAVGERVAAPCPRKDFPFRFQILDTSESNAFSLPGAHVFVTRGLLVEVRSDDELAAVLAHEVGHIADRDFQRLVARQLAYLGLQWGVRRLGAKQLATPIGVAQVLDTLRASRHQEDQADQRGVQFAFEARYDPRAMTAFLGDIIGSRTKLRQWYQRMLDTHPDAVRRRDRCLERTRAVETQDPEGLAALAAALAGRYRLSAALAGYGRLIELRPADPAPHVAAARLYLLRGEADQALSRCHDALRLAPENAEATALLDQVVSESQRAPAPAVPAGPQARTPSPIARPVPPPDGAAAERFVALARGLTRDYRLEQALKWAEYVDPETQDVRWLYLVVKSRLLLMAVDRLRWRLAEVSRLAQSGIEEWPALAAANVAGAEGAARGYDRGVQSGSRAARELDTAAALLPPVMAALAMTGAHQSVGRMSSSRFAMMQGDLLLIENHTRAALDLCRTSAQNVARAESVRLAGAIDRLTARAGRKQRAIYDEVAARRLGLSADAIAALAQTGGGLGAAARSAAESRAGEDASAASPTYEQVESVRIMLKLLLSQLEAETVKPSEGASA
jgi:Zn-dependent protease with chaperone function